MPKFRMPPGCNKVEMQDGSILRPTGSSKRGMVVDVDNADHARAIKRQVKTHGEFIEQGFTAPSGKPGRLCEPCNREWWAWQKVCPKCGLETKEAIPA